MELYVRNDDTEWKPLVKEIKKRYISVKNTKECSKYMDKHYCKQIRRLIGGQRISVKYSIRNIFEEYRIEQQTAALVIPLIIIDTMM